MPDPILEVIAQVWSVTRRSAVAAETRRAAIRLTRVRRHHNAGRRRYDLDRLHRWTRGFVNVTQTSVKYSSFVFIPYETKEVYVQRITYVFVSWRRGSDTHLLDKSAPTSGEYPRQYHRLA